MKLLTIILSVLMALSGCNNADKGLPKDAVLIPVTEKMLKDDMVRFPDSILLKEKLIQYYRDSAAYEKAIATVNEVLQKDSSIARLWEIKATLHFENEDTLNAIGSFETAARLLPSPVYFKLLGSLYAQTKNIKALDIADALLQSKLPDTDKESFFIKGLYYSNINDKIKAISFFDKCLSLNYTYMLAYREKAIALYDMGKYADAVKVLNKAVTLQNNFDEGYYWRGRCLEKLNKPTEAIDEYRTALKYSPDFIEVKEALKRLGVK